MDFPARFSVWIFAALLFVPGAGFALDVGFDPAPWVDDLQQMQTALTTRYANLEWLALEREVDLATLFAQTQSRIESASSDDEAKNNFQYLVRRLGDGHVRLRWSAPSEEAVTPELNCRALGYDRSMRGDAAAPFLSGYSPLADGGNPLFPAGIVSVGGRRVGVLRIGVFAPQGYPELCERALEALALHRERCDDACADRVAAAVSAQMTSELARQLGRLREAGAAVLMVDLLDNGGGTEWYEAAARMVTPVRLKGERIDFVRGPQWVTELSNLERDLRVAAKSAHGADRTLLLGLASQAGLKRGEAASRCDGTPLWHGQRPGCRFLGEGFYSSGLLESADAARLAGKPWASLVFQPMKFPYTEGVWTGPLIVLVNQGSASAAEGFAAELQDNRAAIVLGSPTLGAGCGHTDGAKPFVLSHSRARLELPDCARIRADGSNEVMGVQPDILIGLHPVDGQRRRALRIEGSLKTAVESAVRLHAAQRAVVRPGAVPDAVSARD